MRRLCCLLLAALSTSAHAVDIELVDTEAPMHPRELTVLELVVADEDSSLAGVPPSIEVSAGELLGRPIPNGPGRWSQRYRAPDQGVVSVRAVVQDSEVQASLAVLPWPGSGLEVRPQGVADASRRAPVRVVVSGADLPPAESLVVAVGEGELRGIEAVDGTLVITWQPGEDPFPRAVPIGVRDDRHPGRRPAWGTVQVRARPTIPVHTDEAGAQVSVSVGKRTYGPVVADAAGVASVGIEVRAGERVAQVETVDSLGNSRRSALPLGTGGAPALVALVEGAHGPLGREPLVHLRAIDPTGQAWRGERPTCRTSLGGSLALVEVEEGVWQGAVDGLPQDVFFDVRVDCELRSEARSSVRVPVMGERPARVSGRVSPEELSADSPKARVQAWLETASGTRLAARNIQLRSELGTLTLDPDSPTAELRADYLGTAAVQAGGDRIHLSWREAPGEGAPWGLELSSRVDGQAWHLGGRALDRAGRPLPGQPVSFEVGGVRQEVLTDEHGWAMLHSLRPLGPGLTVVDVQAGEVRARGVVSNLDDLGPDPVLPDLTAELELTLRSGRVFGVILTTEPKVLPTGSGATARVRLLLEDAKGAVITDVPVDLSASSGVLTRPRLRGDGTYEAIYAPPPGQRTESVRITATGRDGSFASTTTTLQLEPRTMRGALGLSGGYLVGARSLASPLLKFEGQVRLKPLGQGAFIHLGTTLYGTSAETLDDLTGETIRLELGLLPVELGLVVRRERGRLAAWLGSAVVVAPYRLSARFGDQVATQSIGVSPPGVDVFTGGGWRVGPNELQLQLGYLVVSMNADDVGWQGPSGGFMATLGYKVQL